jgi:predicted CopG family antitoxin
VGDGWGKGVRSPSNVDSGETLIPVVYERIRMPTKSVRLDVDLYERVMARKREDETVSETVDRLIDDVSLLDLADDGEYDEERADERKAALERTADADEVSLTDLTERET